MKAVAKAKKKSDSCTLCNIVRVKTRIWIGHTLNQKKTVYWIKNSNDFFGRSMDTANSSFGFNNNKNHIQFSFFLDSFLYYFYFCLSVNNKVFRIRKSGLTGSVSVAICGVLPVSFVVINKLIDVRFYAYPQNQK